MLLILTTSVTNRLHYIVNLLFEEIYGMETDFTLSKEEYLRYEGPKIAYLKENPGDGIFIDPSGLLFEQAVFSHEIPVSSLGEIPVIFASASTTGGFPFDLLTAAFYLVSRYEEYPSVQHDKYGRFPFSASLAARGEFLEKPVVNLWLKLFMDRLLKTWPGVKTRQQPYRYLSTLDIDHAYAYRYKPFFRTIGGIGKSITHGHPGEVLGRFKTLGGFSPDPFDTYRYIREVHEKHGLPALLFILFADYGGDDNNIPVRSRAMEKLIGELSSWSELGIHPSLSSNKHPSRLKREKEGLERLSGRMVTKSRQHFLKFSFPETFHRLDQLGITDEFSMGYASHPGFRAGIANSFYFFDLSRNEATRLRIHPVSVMDVTFRDYLRLEPGESLSRIQEIIRQIRSVNGEFVSLWHNEGLSETGRWKGWRAVYKEMMECASP
ncbi:MAG: polysaccharide deacetylase family protein [bacterium]